MAGDFSSGVPLDTWPHGSARMVRLGSGRLSSRQLSVPLKKTGTNQLTR